MDALDILSSGLMALIYAGGIGIVFLIFAKAYELIRRAGFYDDLREITEMAEELEERAEEESEETRCGGDLGC